ncbi:MAG: extracellular solute-binding protein [Lachnospiraceae bacterium]|nr:extracellular solute-binding protein [Lachnospiraceae bacterium]
MKGTKSKLLGIAVATLMMAETMCGCGSAAQTTENAAADSAVGATAGSEAAAEETTEEVTSIGSDSAQTTLRVAWWGNQVRNDRTVEMLNLYASEHPEVNFEVEFIEWGSYWEKLATEAAGGELPDIIQMDYSYLLQYQQKNLLANMNEFIDNGTIDISNCSQSTIDSGKVDDNLYALCAGSSAQCLLYNKTVTDSCNIEVPEQWTWQEFLEVAQQVYDQTGMKIEILSNDERTMENLARGEGKVLLPSEGGALGVEDSSIPLKYFQLIEDTINSDYHVTVEELADLSSSDQGFLAQNKTWCVFTYNSMCVSVVADCDESIEWGISMWPSYEGDTVQEAYVKPSMFYSIAETSENKEEAAKVLDFITNSIEANQILLTDRGLPVSSVISAEIIEGLSGIERDAMDYIPRIEKVATTINPPSPSGSGEVGALVTSLVEQVRYGQMSAQEAADEFFVQANEILQEAQE